MRMISSPLLSIMKSIVCILIALMRIVPSISSSPSKGEANDVKLTSEDANSFLSPTHNIVSRTLHHECYEEGCTFEEVAEVKGTNKEAYEYFFTYTCSKFNSHCQVRCTYRQDCSVGDWGSWSGYVNGQRHGCYEQTRSKLFKHPLQTTYRRMSCGELKDNCGSPPTEKRKQCVCQKADCRQGSWKQWTGDIAEGSCGQQTRTRPFSLGGWRMAQQTGSCSGVQTTCPPPESEDRTMCRCKFSKCSLGKWSEWEPKELKENQCGQQQTRRKTYSLSFVYQMYVDECPSLPQTCPDDIVENRTQCGPTSEPENRIEAPTTEAQSATYISLGCFKDGGKKPRPLPILIVNFRKQGIDRNNLNKTIQACADEAKAQGYGYFAIQNYGQCWSGPNAGETYAKNGRSEKCVEGVGKKKSNAVYRITNLTPPW